MVTGGIRSCSSESRELTEGELNMVSGALTSLIGDFCNKICHEPTYAARQNWLIDHLVGAGKEGWRNGDPERFGGLEIDHQLEPGRLLHRQVRWFRPVEDSSDIDAGQTI